MTPSDATLIDLALLADAYGICPLPADFAGSTEESKVSHGSAALAAIAGNRDLPGPLARLVHQHHAPLVRSVPEYTYIRTTDLVSDTIRLAEHLPCDFDAIVGVPRSGMLPASLLAMHLHLPLFSIDGREPRLVDVGHGDRLKDTPRGSRLLLIDDTICTGRSMAEARGALAAGWPDSEIATAAVYATPQNLAAVDFAACRLPTPHWLEWNLFNSGLVADMAFDLDGVIHGHRGRPLYLPRKTAVGAIITARFECQRAPTEEWLAEHGVLYERLLMGPWQSTADRNVPGHVARWKADRYCDLAVKLYIESEPGLAREIARLSGKRTLCPATAEVFGP